MRLRRFAANPILLRALDAVARRYSRMPGDVVPSATAGMSPGAREWYDLIMAWACLEAADDQLREFVMMANGRGDLVVPTVPITSWPR